MWRTCILPEVLGRWYTRKHNIAAPSPMSTPGRSICYCRRPPDEMIVGCENLKCPFIEFHSSCLEISGPLPKPWYCPSCRLLPQCKKLKRAPNKTLQNLDEALNYNSICICKAKPKAGEKLLKCHSTNCQNGFFFIYNASSTRECRTTVRPHGFAVTVKSTWLLLLLVLLTMIQLLQATVFMI